ncbi:MAG TPA: DHA2 family efflux MFS transporter permease subunit [Candidatus Binataceae bacterium]|nr:DHA2 family efflux MFS transporter permease subunit [Candidatus Binataceae bacterium]
MGAAAGNIGQPSAKPRANPWIIAAVVSLAAFMEVLDTSIANVALPYMAGGLAVSVDNASWVLTSYLVANAAVLPISGWLSIRFGRKRYYLASVVIFTVSSFLCGMAPSLGMLILFRILQGAGGGGLQPVSQAILKDTFPPEQLGIAFAVYGMVVVMAPAVGPTLGGWITDNYQWRWIFYINVPVGIVSMLLASRLVEDPPYLLNQIKKARKYLSIDYLGIGTLALALGSLQVVLDKGQEDNWFHSSLITWLAVIFPIALMVFLIRELTARRPVMDLRMFKNRNFAGAAVMMLIIGFQIYSTNLFIPQYVQNVLGYTAELSGFTQAPGALLMILLMPVVGKLVTRVQARWLIFWGFLLRGLAVYHMTDVYLQLSFGTAMMYRVWQSFGIALLFIPVNTASYIGVPEEKGGEVSGTINLLRNVGGSLGISTVETMLARREQFHQNLLITHVTPAQQPFRALKNGMSSELFYRGLSHSQAANQATLRIYHSVITQATILSYMDVAWILAILCFAMMPLALLLKKNNPKMAHVSAE